MTIRPTNSVLQQQQQGAALAIALMFLLIMTILGVSGLSNTALQEKMTGNLRDKQMSLQGAESGLRHGEQWLCEQPSKLPPIDNGVTNDGLFMASVTGNAVWSMDWKTATDVIVHPGTFNELYSSPRYIIEEVQEVRSNSLKANQDYSRDSNNRMLYRITSHSFGGSGSAESLVQSTFAKK